MENMDIIDVDLVPVFTFKPELLKFYPEIWNNIHDPKWLNGHSNDFKKDVNAALAKHFLIVPKPLEGSSAWRLDFHDAEIQIIKSKQCAKPVIKLLKLFRDGSRAQIMKPLFSYSLKTIGKILRYFLIPTINSPNIFGLMAPKQTMFPSY